MIKKFNEFLNEAKLEYSDMQEMNNAKHIIHDPEYFVYANYKLWRFSKTMCSIINKYAKLNMYVYGQYGKIDGEKCIVFIDRNSDACICMVPHFGRTDFASLYYFKNIEANMGIADFYMSSDTIGIVNLVKTFCSMIIDAHNIDTVGRIAEAKDHNLRKLVVTPKAEAYAKNILSIKPGQKGKGGNKTWEGTWTQELINEIREGVNIYDISEDIETKQDESKYWKYFGAEQKMAQDYIDTLLVFLLRKAGVSMESDKEVELQGAVYNDEDDWFQRVTKMTKADATKLIRDYDNDMKSIEEVINDFVDFYKAKGSDKLDILKYTRQLLIIPGKGGIGKTTIVKKLLSERGLRKNIDFVDLGSASSDAESIYNFCYDYNGKIIILDDIPKLFEGSLRTSLWKKLISGNMGEYGEPSVPARQTTTRYYDPKKYERNNRARYYAEAGDGTTMGEAKTKALNAALKSSNPAIRAKAEKEEEELSMSSKVTVKPSTFTFKGVIIALTNQSPEDLKAETGGAQSWQAIKTRARVIPMNPPGWVLWLKDKDTLLAQKDDATIPDEATLIPRNMIDEYINFVESTISDGSHDNFSFRITRLAGCLMRKGRDWKRTVIVDSASTEEDFN